MALRAPKPEPAEPDAQHDILGHWEKSRWLRVLTPEGKLWAETSNPVEAREEARLVGGTLQRRYDFIPAECRWITEDDGSDQ